MNCGGGAVGRWARQAGAGSGRTNAVTVEGQDAGMRAACQPGFLVSTVPPSLRHAFLGSSWLPSPPLGHAPTPRPSPAPHQHRLCEGAAPKHVEQQSARGGPLRAGDVECFRREVASTRWCAGIARVEARPSILAVLRNSCWVNCPAAVPPLKCCSQVAGEDEQQCCHKWHARCTCPAH